MSCADGADLRRLKTVSIDQERLTVTAGGGCQAVDLEAPLQGALDLSFVLAIALLTVVELGFSVVMGAANDTGSCLPSDVTFVDLLNFT